jgi:AbiU2
MRELRAWIRAAEAARATCLNVHDFDVLIRHQKQRLAAFERGSLGSRQENEMTTETSEPHSAEKIRKITNLALNDALHILALIELLRRQNTGGVNARLSKAGGATATTAVRNAMIGYLVLLISRAYADPRQGDLHFRVAADLLKSDKTAREIFDSGNRSKKVADFEAHWNKCRGDHRLQRITHFRDKYTAHLGEAKDIPEPEFRELFEFGSATVQAIDLLGMVTGVAVKSIEENNDAVQSAEVFWNPWTKDPAPT